MNSGNIINNCISFKILEQNINLYSETLSIGRNTVAEINNKFYHLGPEYPGIAAAMLAWEAINGRELTDIEVKQILDTI